MECMFRVSVSLWLTAPLESIEGSQAQLVGLQISALGRIGQ